MEELIKIVSDRANCQKIDCFVLSSNLSKMKFEKDSTYCKVFPMCGCKLTRDMPFC